MADLKISALPAATTPVAGTEVLPIVQSSTTKKLSIDDVTKGRVVNALTFDTDVAAAGVTLTGTTLAADGTDTNIDINITPKGSGEVNITKVDIDAGAIDGTAIGAGSASTGAFTTLTSSSGATLDGGVVVNEPGADVDFRVEGDTDANLFFVDASTDRVGVGTNAPAAKFDVAAATSVVTQIGTLSGTATEFATLQFYYGNANSPHIPSKIYAKNVGNTGPGGTGAANLVIATADGFYNQTLVDRMTFTHDGKVLSLPIYDTTVGGTNRDVFVDDTGLIGYVSSVRASKANIVDLSNPFWLLQLNPVSFNYRKKDEDGKYTNEVDTSTEYGLIAEDAEAINPAICFYDIVDGEHQLRGVHYTKLVTPMLKLIQEQQKAIENLQAEISALKNSR